MGEPKGPPIWFRSPRAIAEKMLKVAKVTVSVVSLLILSILGSIISVIYLGLLTRAYNAIPFELPSSQYLHLDRVRSAEHLANISGANLFASAVSSVCFFPPYSASNDLDDVPGLTRRMQLHIIESELSHGDNEPWVLLAHFDTSGRLLGTDIVHENRYDIRWDRRRPSRSFCATKGELVWMVARDESYIFISLYDK
ncbi:hypothetical protein [Litoreibacter roseus]|uniref:hypothetical protein n=1 Tax=Litoreibacter roseus TaxID=2601869 RepID=UPI001357FCE8|nr:hypothetical protein [Litoreibacter roseus]